MLPNVTYIIRFELRDRSNIEYEEQEYTTLDEAWEVFRLFAEPSSAELYTCIEMFACYWTKRDEPLIAKMEFAK